MAALAEEIRNRFIDFFVARGHLEQPGWSLVPPSYDASVLFTTAGMQQFKPYFRGEETPPNRRLVTLQKCFRTTDIARVGQTRRHVTFFEMLGNFSIGDYFKREATQYAMELSIQGYELDPNRIWATVFGGDDALGLGPDDEAIECWRALGVPAERIVRLGVEDNFWQAGPTGPCGPSSELYYDRGPDFGGADDRPGDDSDRHLEYWNLVFMQYELGADRRLTPLPQPNIDTGLGLDRLAAILQDAPSVYDTAHFEPMQRVIRDLSGIAAGDAIPIVRARRILADHSRAMTFLISDGVVPSNEDRGYILRRLIRRALHEGARLEAPSGFLSDVVDGVIEAMGARYPEIVAQRETVMRWVDAEERSYGRALQQGTKLLDEHLAAGTLDEPAAFELHDTYGFPFEMTQEIAAEQGITLDPERFEQLMDEQRARSRASVSARHVEAGDPRAR